MTEIVDERQRLVARLDDFIAREQHVDGYVNGISYADLKAWRAALASRPQEQPRKATAYTQTPQAIVRRMIERMTVAEWGCSDDVAILNGDLNRLQIALSVSPAAAQGWQTALVDRFLAWRLPMSVRSDVCVTKAYWEDPHWALRTGTNLLTADEARQMIEYLLAAAPPSPAAQEQK